MLGVIAKIPVKEGKVDAFLEAVKGLMVEVAKEEGTILYTINRSANDPNTLVAMEQYKDRAALEAHSSSPHFKAFSAKLAEYLNGPPEIQILEQVLSI